MREVLRALRTTLCERRYGLIAAAVTLAYTGGWIGMLLVSGAIMRGGTFPDSVDTRILPVTLGKWFEIYSPSLLSLWNFPLAGVQMFWEPSVRGGLSGTLVYISLGFFARMTLIAMLGGLTLALLAALVRRSMRAPSRDVLGASAGVGVAAVGSSVGAPMAAFAGG